MAETDDTTALPDSVAETATQSADLPERQAIVLGTFGTPDAPAALLRLPGGATATVRPGSLVDGAEVIAIDATRVALARNGRAHWIAMPEIRDDRRGS